MAKHQLGIEVNESDIEEIVAFLETLTGEYNGKKISD